MTKPTRVTNSILEHRRRLGMTQGELAARVGVTRQTLNAIELGKYSPSLELAFKLARLFDRGLEDLFAYQDGQRRDGAEVVG